MYILDNQIKGDKKWVGQLSNTPLKNGHLTHVYPKLYNKCPSQANTTCHTLISPQHVLALMAS